MIAEELVAISPSDAVSFSWWCVKQVALLYGVSEEGQPLQQCSRQNEAHWELVHHLLPLTFRLVQAPFIPQTIKMRFTGCAGDFRGAAALLTTCVSVPLWHLATLPPARHPGLGLLL